MPACSAVSDAEIKEIRSFVQRGGMVVADTTPGILDAHCRLLPTGSFDDLFGVTRTGLPKPSGTAIQLDHDGLKTELPLTPKDTQIKPNGAGPWATAEDAPCVLVREANGGRTVLLNTAIEEYEALHNTGEAGSIQALMRRLLALADVKPQVRLTTADGAGVEACEIVRFAEGDIEYVCIVSDDDVIDAKPQDVTILFPRKAHVYDVRARQAVGETQTVETTLVPGDPKIYALLPYGIAGVAVKPAATQVPAGGTATFDVAPSTGGAELAGRHCLRIETVGPDGKPRKHYAQNVLIDKPATAAAVELALNDAPGRWEARVTDVARGVSGSAAFSAVGQR